MSILSSPLPKNVIISTLPEIPGTRIISYLSPVQLHFIKDSWSIRGEGLLSSFFYGFISELNAVTQAHVASLGANALLNQRSLIIICF